MSFRKRFNQTKNKMLKALMLCIVCSILFSCSGNNQDPKGFTVNQQDEDVDNELTESVNGDTLQLSTRPGGVLLTGNKRFRLTPVYKVNLNKRKGTTYIGSNSFYRNYSDYGHSGDNQWHYNFMPGLEAVYGYNMVNVWLYDNEKRQKKAFFDQHGLIRTLYYPSFSNDTLNGKSISRDYYMISVYHDDTNHDGRINEHDLRRFYYFDALGSNRTALIPEDYSVISSEYDSANDYMYVYAKHDKNGNGKGDDWEEIHVFWIELSHPLHNGRLY
jgi:hypothetical protein